MSGEAVLVLDQSHSCTGFALWHECEAITGSWPLSDGVKNRAEGYRELWGKMDAFHKKYGLGLIIHETPVLGAINKGQAQIFGTLGLVAIIELFCISRGLGAPISYPPQSWRTTFFSKAERKAIRGKDWKRPAIERARQLGFDPSNDNEAEAFAILDHYLAKHKIMPYWRDRIDGGLDPVA